LLIYRFLVVVVQFNSFINPKNGKHSPLVADEIIVKEFKDEIEKQIDHERSFAMTDYFGFKH